MEKTLDGYSKQGEESPSSLQDSEKGEMEGPSPPVHPVPSMQGAFEESIKDMPKSRPKRPRHEKVDATTRRRVLLRHEQGRKKSVYGKHLEKPPQRYHPLWKLVAQISFGIHLLHMQLAKSDAEVTKILQMHVDDLDEFVEDTTEDFELAQSDIEERIKNLRVPLEHLAVFDQMLDDKEFRAQIIDGNEKIEYIINRTAAAMNRALGDIQEGIKATDELARYLLQVNDGWENRSDGLVRVYAAMTSNVEAWYRCLVGLQVKGNSLGVALVKLGSIVAEMQKRAGMASRKIRRVSSQIHKPLPTTPNPIHPAVQATLPRLTSQYSRAFPPDANFRHPAHVRNESIAPDHKSIRGSIHNTLSFYKERTSTYSRSDQGSPTSSPLSPDSEKSGSELRRASKATNARQRPMPEQYPKPLAEKEVPNNKPPVRRKSRIGLFSGSLRRT
ncbi:hypothetical protein FGG08_002708 [Glutinoglossum americanum]|uniref:Uncharacterized protein n=1 Tax=Glutinoglossum americanum TaxID=1670608 RepID=A0A9P8I5S8_9PEZI|nr:hypothetical protein FGG08_002708 [Glutinoglossum americanum]